MKKALAYVICYLIMSPVIPLYTIVQLGHWLDEKIPGSEWVRSLVRLTERVEKWGGIE